MTPPDNRPIEIATYTNPCSDRMEDDVDISIFIDFLAGGENDADIMHNSALCNLNVSYYAQLAGVKKILFSSSACIYPERNQLDPDNPKIQPILPLPIESTAGRRYSANVCT